MSKIKQPRIYLSPPHLSGEEEQLVKETLDSNWIAPLGPQVDAFEREFANTIEVAHTTALSSGTAALHLALELLGVGPGDTVLCPTLTFVASANPIRYLGADPIFIDSTETSWNLDPSLLEEEIEELAAAGSLPKAVIVVDLYGQSADYEPILQVCDRFDLPVVEDAAEALGATYRDRPVGSFGTISIFSFNGNKIITTSGGGMLASANREFVERARFLATQAREPVVHYEHQVIGYNYRMSNLLAAVGRAQLAVLDDRVATRRRVFKHYVELLGDLPGLHFMPEAIYGVSTRWLTCATVDPTRFGASREDLCQALEAENIEARPVWKPMHLQPLYRTSKVRERGVAADLFKRGLCLPSGSSLSSSEIERIAATVRSVSTVSR